ncbi:MAG: MFS transporter [Halobacteriales archaeon]|nr:MFS transporter [Halobacteriales archaeon]
MWSDVGWCLADTTSEWITSISLPVDGSKGATIGLAGATRTAIGILVATGLAVYVGREASPFAVASVLAAYSFGVMLFSPIWGAIADITRRRRTVLIGTGVLATLSLLLLSVVQNIWLSIAMVAVYAAFAAGFLPVLLTIVSEHGGATNRGRAIGNFNSAKSVGATGARFLVGVLLALLTSAGFFFVMAIGSLVATIAVVFVDDPTADGRPLPTLRTLLGEVRRRLIPVGDGRTALTANGLHWLYLAHGFRNMTISGLMSLLPVYLIVVVGTSATEMGLLLGLGSALQILFMSAFGRVVDARGRKSFVVYGMVGSGAFALFAAGATLPGGLLFREIIVGSGFVVRAIAVSAIFAGTYAFIGDVAPIERESELMGMLSTVKGIGGVIGPLLLGAVATIWGYEIAFAGSSLFAFAAAAFVAKGVVESYPAPSINESPTVAGVTDD